MPQHLPDLTSVVNSCVLFMLIALLWVHRTKPTNVSLSALNSLLIPLKIAFLHGLIFAALLPFPGYAAASVPFLAVCCLCLLPFATIEAIPGGDTSAYAVGKMLLIPLYAIRQFVIGFPDRDLLRNRRPGLPLIDQNTTPLWIEDE